MCGIVSFCGKSSDTKQLLLDALQRLEYRGYDSCGLALVKENQDVFLYKRKGRIEDLKEDVRNVNINSHLGIAHTRWATHGAPNKINAHPHFDCHRKIFVVHNGIIENYQELKNLLIKEGHRFLSDTDTEIIPHLIEKFYEKDLIEAVFKAVKMLKGSFSFCVFSLYQPSKIIGVRFFSPLILGVSSKGMFLASDIPAFLPYTQKVVYLPDRTITLIEKDNFKIYDFNQKEIKIRLSKTNLKPEQAQKENYPHFMLKEIFEQPKIMERLYKMYIRKNRINLPYLNISSNFLKRVKRIYIVGCGTAYHAGLVGKYLLEKFSGVNCLVEVSSEFRYKFLNVNKDEELCIFISQSGETADTLASLREAKTYSLKTLGICNVLGSSLTREVDSVIYTYAGPEISVASTKAYTAQIFTLLLFSLYLGRLKGNVSSKFLDKFLSSLKKISLLQKSILDNQLVKIKKIAKKFSKAGSFLYLGRNINYPSALEGALKLKEISYIPAEGYAAGEMKHGPIALIDEYRVVVCINPASFLYEKMLSNMEEINARKGKILGILTDGDKKSAYLCKEKIFIPYIEEELTPLLVALPLQLFAYFVAVNLGYDVDKPRNLAKSVTVE